ncbi:phenylacetate--CoA ligase family protein [Pseudobacteroides cellulosolvens]|uniref:Phenylacetate-coenzyme A ligase n=1 Tax=Pseudobacteroides cellulosolvens ATCC 35603 = DSM 2933 TaxID=398512 RepID=A0A0L6JIM4_9FIRM|nr:phenylacetate--CoA ligase [Pseudobacteroides cellulosolvens]KNY25594.1 Phenylacetate--CoA ligase [Pseudobacteroides cellulosolvens ATCC 35603 = DSM 2933]
MRREQFESFKELLERLSQDSPFYKSKFNTSGVNISDIMSPEDISQLPFTTKEELRDAYPLGLQAVPDEKVVRIHSSSGTTGKPVIIPYTSKDVDDWAIMMARCFKLAGITPLDRVQITPGYGLWTAGIGFQAGVEKVGAMAIPMGPGNTDKQLQMMMDLKSTVFASTSSYALVLAEEVEKRGIRSQIHLKKGIIGSERWGEKMRNRIKNELGVDIYDIYGLTEIYGPGISLDCDYHTGLHYWDDFLYFEIIDPITCQPLKEGEYGELVITTLKKEGAPLLRYRTRDLTRLIPGNCPCGSTYPRHDVIIGRTDDMVKVKGVNIYPGQIDELLRNIEGASSEYQVVIKHINGKDEMTLRVEKELSSDDKDVREKIVDQFKKKVGIHIEAEVLAIGELPRSEKKSKRIIDFRYQ